MKVRTMRGELLDMGLLMAKNDKKRALGNANMNARGDIVGRNGEIVKAREQLAKEYYAANPKAVKQVALNDISKEVFMSPAEAAAKAFGNKAVTPSEQLAKTEQVKQATVTPATNRKRKIEDRED